MGRREWGRGGGGVDIVGVDLGQMSSSRFLTRRRGSTSTHCGLNVHHGVLDV